MTRFSHGYKVALGIINHDKSLKRGQEIDAYL